MCPDDPAVVSDAQALSGSNSVAVSGGSDLVHTYAGYTSGKWTYTASQYIPSTSTGTQYFILAQLVRTGERGVEYPAPIQLGYRADER